MHRSAWATWLVDNIWLIDWALSTFYYTEKNVKVRSYITWYPVRPKGFILQILAALFIRTPTWLLWEAFNHMQVLHTDYSLTFPPLSTARYSFLQLSKLGHGGENENAKGTKWHQRGIEQHRLRRFSVRHSTALCICKGKSTVYITSWWIMTTLAELSTPSVYMQIHSQFLRHLTGHQSTSDWPVADWVTSDGFSPVFFTSVAMPPNVELCCRSCCISLRESERPVPS